ncbi:hypothetical protein FIL70_11520 [Sphingobium fuliginis ATCC 27551]|uniref:Acyl-CoA dehydrogenase n=2 Tax=Sphingobium fuliginis (strain ATCC 27551) TaxID=336203 RepID=A0A5B8CFA6_SPHSA|nr:hypothetical protein FIL70_11520 [Sphingobium fuliginis ATCC 27551]
MTAPMIEDEIDAALDDVARKFAANEYVFEERHRLNATERRFSGSAWSSIAEMGWLSVATPEEFGGLGLRISSITVLAEAAGAMFLNEPLTDTAFCGAYLVSELGSPLQKADMCPRILDGSLRLSVALDPAEWLPASASAIAVGGNGLLTGSLPLLPGADIADRILVRATDPSGATAIYSVNPQAEGVEVSPYPLVDGRGAASVTLAGAAGELLGEQGPIAETVVRNALAIGALATAADSLGVMNRALNTTVEYMKTRVQFGRPIGENQVLQHRAVDMHMLTQEARAVVAASVNAGGLDSKAFHHHVHAAKAIVDTNAREVAHGAIQLHGGIGMADEHVAGLCLWRVMVNEQLFGQQRDHMDLFGKGLPEGFDLESAD